ncbi:MAG: glycosyltransferase family A protein [Bacteroidales bacterium]|nr:glycosyltransferase family A protein [Bacteroidales bacterium]MDD4771805.1 glycosyltransferase family A protein [Bacteroidales bacterium]
MKATTQKLTYIHAIHAEKPVNPSEWDGLNVQWITLQTLHNSADLKKLSLEESSPYILIQTGEQGPVFGAHGLQRLLEVANDTQASLLYCDYWQDSKEGLIACPLNDYQTGSIRDDFELGPIWCVRKDCLEAAQKELPSDLSAAALYAIRLSLSRQASVFHLREMLYTIPQKEARMTETQFSYVDPKNRSVQVEMETVCTQHLKAIGAWLDPSFESLDLSQGTFEHELTVIIPVKNRSKTILDAIDSVLSQQTTHRFNLIVVDNHSTDGTSDLIATRASQDRRLLHLIPERTDLGIGGCWNEALHHPQCGRFALQLDSDDVYSDNRVIEDVIQAFYAQGCAMLIGSYRICNFQLQTIPPGLIDHREWTEDNGKNNALRINGLGAPRAFYTPIARRLNLPNTSYGEDYAIGLRISRTWKIGRLYRELYLCRRWDENSDADLPRTKLNQFNAYKDQLRSIEIGARQQRNKHKQL